MDRPVDSKLLLVKSITLLYRESLLPNDIDSAKELVRTVLDGVKLSDINITINHERDILSSLKQTALDMCDNPNDHIYELPELLQRLKVNSGNDDQLYESIVQGLDSDLSESSLKRTVSNIRKSISNHFKDSKIDEILTKAASNFRYKRSGIKNVTAFVAEICGKLEPFQLDSNVVDPAIISDIDTSDVKGLSDIYNAIQQTVSGASSLRTGLQGLNALLGGNGFARGEEWVIGALQHQFKTGFSLMIFKQIALYNKPVMTDITKKPLLLRISFEDSLKLNLQAIYQSLKENEIGEMPSVHSISTEEMAEYVQTKLGVNGYHTRFMHVNPSLWTYRDVCNQIIKLESEGYEVHLCMLDYLLKLPTTGCDSGPMGHDIRNMFERIRNFMTARNILVITPHQLSPDAKRMIREGKTNFVKQLVGGGYYSGCSQLDQVVDGEIFIHIEIINGESYLTIQRGKHRGIEQTPVEDRFVVYKFNGKSGILDDINIQTQARKKVGGGTVGSGEETPFWANNDTASQI